MPMTPLCWTAEKPTQPGWYWYQPDPSTEPIVLKVNADLKTTWCIGIAAPGPIVVLAGKWAGPITPPG
jgi:hypothetical protein